MRWLLRGLVLLVGLIVVAGGGAYVWLLGSLPKLNGTVAVPRLEAPVEVVRDRHGIPHIYAASQSGAFFGLGFVHAQDRLWQMELSRRIGAGRIAEVIGSRGIDTDRFLRTLSVYEYAERNYDNLDAETRSFFDAYADGVNAFLETRSGPLPPEFVMLQHRPEPWRPADSLVWGKMMAWSLSGNWSSELFRARLTEQLDDEQIADLFPAFPEGAAVKYSDLAPLYRAAALDRLWAAAAPLAPDPGNGSNNWVVAGSRTATGKPLLANDPHLGLSVPSVWYFAHLNAPGLDVIGATLPGMPAVLLGRNKHIAWGFTNTSTDAQDLFIEKLDAADSSRYMTPQGPRPFEVRQEVIRVRGGEQIPLVVRMSRHGPVLSDAQPRLAEVVEEGHVVAMAWTALRDVDGTPRAVLDLGRAANRAEFVAALAGYETPQQNIVYADRDGTIGFYAPGRVPVRKPGNGVNGIIPVPGWTGDYDWVGFIPFTQLPHSFNPPSGAIATANHKIVPDNYPYHITYDWEPAYRVRRIDELLASRTTHSIASFTSAQGDVTSRMATDFLPLLLEAEPLSEVSAQARALLRQWDGAMERNRPEPLIFAAWYRNLTRMTYADEFGELFDDAWRMRPLFMFDVLKRKPDWCDDRTTPARESCNTLIAEALDLTVSELTEEHGADIDKWRWGDAHYAHMKHQPFTLIPLLRNVFDVKLPSSGGGFTLNRGAHRIGDRGAPFANVHGASMRAIYDLDDLDRSLYIHSTGQSGNRLSPLYSNFARPWRDLEYVPMTTRRDEVEAGAIGTLRLVPAGGAPAGSG